MELQEFGAQSSLNGQVELEMDVLVELQEFERLANQANKTTNIAHRSGTDEIYCVACNSDGLEWEHNYCPFCGAWIKNEVNL